MFTVQPTSESLGFRNWQGKESEFYLPVWTHSGFPFGKDQEKTGKMVQKKFEVAAQVSFRSFAVR
jgi:hypothetical protein